MADLEPSPDIYLELLAELQHSRQAEFDPLQPITLISNLRLH